MCSVIVLVVILGGIEFCIACDLGDDGLVIGAALIQLRLVMFGLLFLLFIMLEDGAAVLRTYVITLSVEAGRVVCFPEHFQQLVIGDDRGIVNDLEGFRMTGGAGAYFLIGGVGHGAACIAGGGFYHTL